MVTGKFKFLVLILIFVFGINMISAQSFAADTSPIITTSDGYMFNTETGIITDYTGNGGNIEIPSQINGIKVIGIDIAAFDNCTDLTAITIPDSVTSIDIAAFNNCTGLTAITIPDSVTSIEGYAFSGCTSLKNITFPGVTYLGDSVFSDCHLESVTIPKTLKSYYFDSGDSGDGSPLAYSKIDNVIFEDGSAAIQSDLFFLCDFKSITIPSSVTSIDQDISHYYHDLTIITYPGTYADKYAQSNNMTVKYSVPEDINGDRAVNMEDVILVASHFNTTSPDSDYDIKCDLNNDKVINLIDIMMIAAKFNYTY